MTISPRFLEELRNRLTLSDIIGRRIKVTRAGREFKACCPFHREKTPSFTINDDKQFFHCFGCGANGDIVGFVMRHDNRSFPEAVELLAAEAGMQMPKPDPATAQRAEKQKSLHDLLNEASLYFEQVLDQDLDEGRTAKSYLTDRGMSEESISSFRVGYAPADGQALRKHLKSLGYTDSWMIEAGILKPSNRGGDPYSFFRERIMFPVSDRRGRIVAFGGRILPDHLRPADRGHFTPPKYMNSSDTPLFDKSRVLYGQSLARQALREDHTAIVTEGYMDVIACHQAGFKGAIAPMGTALTDEQILLLWSMIPQEEKMPVLCFDGDNAGRRAAERACDRILPLLKPNHSIKLAFMPDGEDPDSLLRSKGKAGLKSVLESALPLFEFIWLSHVSGKRFNTPESRAGVVKSLEQRIAVIADRSVQSHYRALLRRRVSETFFQNKKKDGAQHYSRYAVKLRKPSQQRSILSLKVLLATIINHPSVYGDMEDTVGSLCFPDARLDLFRQEVISILSETPGLDTADLQAHLNNVGFEKEMGDILNESVYVHGSFARPHANIEDNRNTVLEWVEDIKERVNRKLLANA